MEKIEIHKIIRTKRRRTIALIVGADATLTVRAPLHTPLDYIERLVKKKISWIKAKIREIRMQPNAFGKEFVPGESFLFLGQPYRLRFSDDTQARVDFRDGFIVAQKYQSHAKKLLTEWYKYQARKRIGERVEWYARVLGLKYQTVKITGAQNRWGSCSPDNNLNFSWRLIMAPLSVVDYVVVHELTHLQERNHSKGFWNRIRDVFPDYKERVKWLKENEPLMSF